MEGTFQKAGSIAAQHKPLTARPLPRTLGWEIGCHPRPQHLAQLGPGRSLKVSQGSEGEW